MDDAAIGDAIVALLAARAPSASICPSEAARALRGDEAAWRALMPEVRRVASVLAARGVVEATQGGRSLPATGIVDATGPLRLRRGHAFPATG